jgi:replicative DNA helicase
VAQRIDETAVRSITPDRVPPQNLDAEASLLGSMMLSTEAISEVISQVEADDFYRSANQEIFRALLAVFARGEPVDAITAVEELKRNGKLEAVGGHLYIHDLVGNVTTPASAGHYARIVAELALMRRMITAAADIMQLGYSSPTDPGQAADEAEEMIYRVARRRDSDEVAPMSSLVDEAMNSLERMSDQHAAGVPTGFADLDRITSGLQKQNLIVLAARPGVGKSSLAVNIARNVAVEAEKPVVIFSLEMSKAEIGMRLLCGEARVSWTTIRANRPTADDWTRVVQAAEVLHDAPVYVVDSGNTTIVDIRAAARRMRHKLGELGLVIVDYLQLMASARRVENRQQEIAEISRGLKMLAKDLDIPVMAVSQLNRDPERRTDKRPQLSDLRESGAIEQDADVVMFINRDDSEDPTTKGTADLILAKHRNGPTGTVKLTFLPHLTQFRNFVAPR